MSAELRPDRRRKGATPVRGENRAIIVVASRFINNEQPAMNQIEPGEIAGIRDFVRRSTGATEQMDRRGFRLLQWPSPITGRKPIELSLEHEARLKPTSTTLLHSLSTRLALSPGQPASRFLVSGSAAHENLTIDPVIRRPGPQSVDVYFDLPDGGFVSAGYTFRQRLIGRQFMTWLGEGDDLPALNLELPAVSLNRNALTARLEFNWLDRPASALGGQEEADTQSANRNPVCLTASLSGLDLRKLIPTFENTTVRQKFLLRRNEKAAFALNVDFIRTRNLRRDVEARFVDIDLSSMNPIDSGEMDALAVFSEALMSAYSLEFNFQTKASRAMRVLEAS